MNTNMEQQARAVVSPAYLAAGIRAGTVRVIDCRNDPLDSHAGHQAWSESRIPGAVHASLEGDLAAPRTASSAVWQLPSLHDAAVWLYRLGLREGMQVVCYDQGVGVMAARCWWLLRWLGHAEVAVLDGGMPAWRRAGLPEDQGPPELPPVADFHYRLRGNWLTTADYPLRSGAHVIHAGARKATGGGDAQEWSLPAAETLTDIGTLRSTTELYIRFMRVLASAPDGRICHCSDTGLSACLNMLAMVHAGLDAGRLLVHDLRAELARADAAIVRDEIVGAGVGADADAEDRIAVGHAAGA